MKKGVLIFVFALTFLAGVLAQPPTFHQFYGGVTFAENGSAVGANYSVKAYFNGSLIEEGLTDSSGNYGWFDLFIVENVVDGSTLTFSVDDRFVTNYTFSNEGITQLDLSFNSTSETVCIDNDLDGYNATGGICGALDCNDYNSGIHPGASDVCGNGIDEDCSGSDLVCPQEEGPSGPSSSPSGSITQPYFTINDDTLNVTVLEGETAQTEFTISNPTTSGYTVYVQSNLAIALVDTEFVLSPGTSRTVSVPIDATQLSSGVYVGNILVWSSSTQQNVSVSVEVVTGDSLFDIILDVPDEYNYILPGNNLPVDIYLTNLLGEDQEVTIIYLIKDENGNTVYQSQETRTVNDPTSYVRDFEISEDTKNGKYLIYSQLSYDGKVASSSEWINVGPRDLDTLRLIIIALVLAIAITIIVILIVHHKHKKKLGLIPQGI